MKFSWGWLLLAACGTDPKVVDLAIPGTQVLVTEKVNGGTWTKLSGHFDSTANTTTYSIEVGDEYELVAVCMRSGPRDAGQTVAGELFDTGEDPPTTLAAWEVPDCRFDSTGTLDLTDRIAQVTATFGEEMDLSVSMQPPVHVSPGEAFSIATVPGVHDLIAFHDTRFVLRRNFYVDTTATLAPIYFDAEGLPMLSEAVVLASDPDERTDVSNRLQTVHGARFDWAHEDSHGALYVPVQYLEVGDVERLEADLFPLTAATGSRGVLVDDPRRAGVVRLLPRLAASTLHPGGAGVTWTPITDDYTTATLRTRPDGSWLSVTASKSWLAKHGDDTLDFDAEIDGYDASWSAPLDELVLTRWSPSSSAFTRSIPGAL